MAETFALNPEESALPPAETVPPAETAPAAETTAETAPAAETAAETAPAAVIRNGQVGDWRHDDDAFLANFRLPGHDDKTLTLASKNSFPRDQRIRFEEEEHLYFIRNPDGEEVRAPWSVTGLVKRYHTEFDAPKAVTVMKRSPNWVNKRHEYLRPDGEEMDTEEIQQKWARNGEVQSKRGTLMHWQIEQHLNGRTIEEPLSPEFQQYLVFREEVMREGGLEPFLTEATLFHCGLRVAGQADLLCKDADGNIAILDWKRSKEIKRHGFRGERMLPPVSNLPDCNFFHYALQLGVYRYILETEYGVTVSRMLLGVFHPTRRQAEVVEVPRLDAEISRIVEELQRLGLASEPLPGPEAPFCVQ